MRRFLWVSPAFVISLALGAEPQTDTNVVASADDAFGISLGPESLGIYNQNDVRGFSPLTAGNVRLDGLYFDLQGSMIDPLATDTRIRVGLSATSFPWPAPSGIVDYTLRAPKDTPAATAILYTGPYNGRDIDLNGYTPLPEKHLEVAAGASYHDSANLPGQTSHTMAFGVLPQWTPNANLSISTFWGRQNVTDARPLPVIYVGTGQAPPSVPTRFFGPSWAGTDIDFEHYGILTKAQLSKHWSLRVGLFRSISNSPKSYADLYLNTDTNGVTNHTLIGAPDQYYGSTSGEIQLFHEMDRGSWRHGLVIGIRGRSLSAKYGGADTYNFGTSVVGRTQPTNPVDFRFGPTTTDHLHDYSFGASYTFQWLQHFTFTSALRQDHYSNGVADPILGDSTASIRPWLYNASLAFIPLQNLALFTSFTRGLEDSGVAPSNAINRGEVLNATHSSQEEVGVKYSPNSSLSLLTAAFDIRKSYFALDNVGEFGDIGEERHRGIEFSLTGEIVPGLHIVAGAWLMSPEVIATSTPAQPIGIRPIGQPNRSGQLGVDYRLPLLPALSFDCVLGTTSSRVASVDNRLQIPGYTTMDVGARYRMAFGDHSATLRVQVMNTTNTLNWVVQSDGGLAPLLSRRAWAYLILDL